VRCALASVPETDLHSLGEITKVPVQSLLRLVIDGAVHIDWWRLLCSSAAVSTTPIGRQEWPTPLAVERSLCEEIRCR